MKTEPFSDSEKALFQRALNQGTRQAERALSELMGEEIRVVVANLETPRKRPCLDDFNESTDLDDSVVTQTFQAVFAGVQVTGCACLIFPSLSCKTMCGYFLAHTPQLDLECDIREVVLAETGNIVLNSAMGGFANFLHIPMENELPVVHVDRADAFRHLLGLVRKECVQDAGAERRRPQHLQEHVIQAKVTFGAEQTTFHTQLLIFFDTNAIPMIKAELGNSGLGQQATL